MIDPLLSARLEALAQDLRHISTPSEWGSRYRLLVLGPRSDLCAMHAQAETCTLGSQSATWQSRFWSLIWGFVRSRIEASAEGPRQAIQEARQLLERAEQEQDARQRKSLLEAAWRGYGEAYRQSSEVFGACIEVLGGLALREKLSDSSICEVADDLFCLWTTRTRSALSLAVPAASQPITRSLAPLVRLLYPEWSIWTLPFTAYTYGQAAIDSLPALAKFVERQARASSPRDRRARASQEERLRILLADAFATYVTGPSYACAAFILRFDPLGAPAQHGSAAHAERAYLTLAILERAAAGIEVPPGGERPYASLLRNLRTYWDDIQQRLGGPAQLQAGSHPELDTLAGEIWSLFRTEFHTPALYPPTGRPGYDRALLWHAQWRAELSAQQSPSEPSVSSIEDVPDILVAAWLCRFRAVLAGDSPAGGTIAALTTVAMRLCMRAIGKPMTSELPEPRGHPGDQALLERARLMEQATFGSV